MAYNPAFHGGWHGNGDRRSLAVRVLWGVLAALAGIAGIVLIACGIFAEPDMDKIRLGNGDFYHVNAFHYLYLVASALLPLSGFAAWKSAHRGGLGFWRSTVRPGAMCSSLAMIGLGLSSASHIFTGAFQGLGIIAAGVGAAGLLFFWVLRGPKFELNASDAYWNRALAAVFGLTTLASGIGGIGSVRAWSHDRFRVDRGGEPYTVERVTVDRWDSESDEMRVERKTYRVPRLQYNPTAISSALFGLLALGCLSEMKYRAGLARKSRQLSFDKMF